MRTSYVTRFVRAYPGLKTGTREYYRAAARVARYRRMQRLGRDEYLRQERERMRELRARQLSRDREVMLTRWRAQGRARYWKRKGQFA